MAAEDSYFRALIDEKVKKIGRWPTVFAIVLTGVAVAIPDFIP